MSKNSWILVLACSALLAFGASCRMLNRALERPSAGDRPLAAETSAPEPATPADIFPPAETLAESATLPEISIPNATMIFYEISGSTEDELREQMSALGPAEDDGTHFDAYTRWRIGWNWPGYGENVCTLSEAVVTYEVTVTFPHWVPPADASPELLAKWSDYITALAGHEKGHVDNVVDNYTVLEKAVKDATCTSADDAAQAVIEVIRQNDLDYDAETGHGATQGAVFP